MKKIAILYICTGKYDAFWKDFYLSCEKFFLTKSEKHYFVFTDAEELFGEYENNRIHKVYQEKLGWPYDTLMRFHFFSRIHQQLEKYDYIFFMNANMLCVNEILEEKILSDKEELIVTMHPGWLNKSVFLFPYERNKKSTAYIPYGKGKYYFMGGLNGGSKYSYLKLIESLKNNIQVDLDNGIIAKWHDESQLNCYMLNKIDSVKILTPEYAYPEGWKLSYLPKIIIRDKDKVIDTSNIKGYNSFWVNIKKKIRKIIEK